jgi:hypothetical protein
MMLDVDATRLPQSCILAPTANDQRPHSQSTVLSELITLMSLYILHLHPDTCSDKVPSRT